MKDKDFVLVKDRCSSLSLDSMIKYAKIVPYIMCGHYTETAIKDFWHFCESVEQILF